MESGSNFVCVIWILVESVNKDCEPVWRSFWKATGRINKRGERLTLLTQALRERRWSSGKASFRLLSRSRKDKS